MAIKLGINGFGRIGRMALRLSLKSADLEVVAVNALDDVKTCAHLFRYDSVHGTWKEKEVQARANSFLVGEREIQFFSQKDPGEIPWKSAGVDVVLECTGAFRTGEAASAHRKGGVKKVLISAPGKEVDATICMGINEKTYDPEKHHIISNASCTTNPLAPVAKVLLENFGFKRGLMTTIHAYTNDQNVLDLPHKDLRRARAAALNMIPSSTGAAKAIALVLPELEGRMHGGAIRVPSPNVSLVDLTAELEQKVSAREINTAMKKASEVALKGILYCSEEELVSSDFNGSLYSSIVDCPSTQVVQDTFVKVLAWYDNETAYTQRLLDLAHFVVGKTL